MDIIKTLKKKLFGTHIKPYLSARAMPLYNYEQYLETNDTKWFSNFYEVKDPFNEPLDIDKAIENVYGEILAITKDYNVIKRFENIHKLYKLELKYNDCMRLIIAIETMPSGMPTLNDLVNQLKKWHYRIDEKKELFSQLSRIKAGLNNILNEIESIKKELEKENQNEKSDIEKDKVVIELGLNMGYAINSKQMSVYKYFTLRQQLINKNTELQKQTK
jgi:regulator of replication initiation timing